MVSRQPPLAADNTSAIDVAKRAVHAATAHIVARSRDALGPGSNARLGLTKKGAWNDQVTEVDAQAEEAAVAILKAAFPDHTIIAEESGVQERHPLYRWYIDPIDGTRNFASGIPHVSSTIALYAGSEPLVGVVYDPLTNQMFEAMAGKGAFLNGHRLLASEETELSESVLGVDMGYNGHQGTLLLDMLKGVWPGVQSIRMMGGAALGVAYAGSGMYDLYAHHYVQPWDIAAGILIVRESGGIATDLAGRPAIPESGCIVAGGKSIHNQFMTLTQGSAWRVTGP